jgi:hypothetical protein
MGNTFVSTNHTNDKTINNQHLLSPKMDVVFQALFGSIDSGQITSKFLEAILGRSITIGLELMLTN